MDDEAIGALHAKGGSRIALSSRQPLLFALIGIEYWIVCYCLCAYSVK